MSARLLMRKYSTGIPRRSSASAATAIGDLLSVVGAKSAFIFRIAETGCEGLQAGKKRMERNGPV